MHRLFLSLFLIPICIVAYSQTTPTWNIGIKGPDYTFFHAEYTKPELIRYGNDKDHAMNFNAQMLSFGGVVERRLDSNRLSVESGLYHSTLYLTTKPKSNNWFVHPHYYYALVDINENTLVYKTVRQITSQRSYITIPINVQYELLKKVSWFNVFLKTGLNTSIAIGKAKLTSEADTTSTPIEYYAFAKDNYTSSASLFIAGHAGVGIRIGKRNAVHGRLEGMIPVAFTNKVGNYNLNSGYNINISLHFPLK